MNAARRVAVVGLVLVACSDSEGPAQAPAAPAPVSFSERVSATTELFHRADGTITAAISSGPKFFKDDDGRWQRISLGLERKPDGSLSANRNLLKASFPKNGDGAIRFEDRATGLGISLWLQHAQALEPAANQGDSVRYALPDGSYEEFRILRGAVKHNLVLARPGALDELLVRTGPGALATVVRVAPDNGVRLEADQDAIAVVGPAGPLFYLPPPRAYELDGTRQSTAAAYRYNASAGTIAVEVSEQWLRDPARSFPVAVDPPATVLTQLSKSVVGDAAGGPGVQIFGPDLTVGQFSSAEFYQSALAFDLTGVPSGVTVSSPGANVFLTNAGSGGAAQTYHFARLVQDPGIATPAALFADGVHAGAKDYGTFTPSGNSCNCWSGAAPPAMTGVALNLNAGIAATDIQAALNGNKRFLVGLHVQTYTSGRYATPAGSLEPNEPQLYFTYGTAAPTVTEVSPAVVDRTAGGTIVVRGTNFAGGGGTATTFVLSPIPTGTDIPVPATYLSASTVTLNIPALTTEGFYDVVATTPGGSGSSTKVAADRVAVATVKTWNGGGGNWSTAANWTPGVTAPTASSIVVINAGTPLLDMASAQAAALRINGGTFDLNGNSLQVSGDVSLNAGTLNMGTGTLGVAGNLYQNSGTLNANSGTVQMTNAAVGKRSYVGRGRILSDDFEGYEPGVLPFVPSILSGTPNAWKTETKVVATSHTAYYQQGKINAGTGIPDVPGVAALTSPTFSTAGRTNPTLKWRHRFETGLELGSGPDACDGMVVQVTTNGGTTWSNIAPTAGSVALHPNMAGVCTGNTTTPTPTMLFGGKQLEWVQESVALPVAATVQIRFVAGWDQFNDRAPYDGFYLDDVVVTADEQPVQLGNFTVTNAALVTSLTGLSLSGALNLTNSNTALDLTGKGLTVTGAGTNSGTLIRGPGGNFSVNGAFDNGGTFRGDTGSVTLGSLVNSGDFRGGSSTLTINGNLTNSGQMFVASSNVTVAGNLSNSSTLDVGQADLALTSTGPVTVSGAGQFRQSAFRTTTTFYDGFETGNFTAGSWVLTGGGGSPDAVVVNVPPNPGVGTRVANLGSADNWVNNWITKSLPTTGKFGIWISYQRACQVSSGTSTFHFEYSTDGGGTWRTVQTVTGAHGLTTDTFFLSALDPAVDNNANFQFRFHSNRSNTGTYHFVDEVRVEEGTTGIAGLAITGAGSKLIDSTLAGGLRMLGVLNLSQGTLRINTGRTFSIDNLTPLSSSSNVGATLDVEPNATLKLSANTTLNLAGSLDMLGLAGNLARLTSTDTVTPGRYAINVTGFFAGSYFDVDYANGSGLRLQNGSTVTALNNGTFHHPPNNGALLTIETATVPSPAPNFAFLNEASASNAVSVDGDTNAPTIRFSNATGPLASEQFDRDVGGATPGNILWSPTQFAITTPPRSLAAGACSSVTLQLRDQGNQTATAEADVTLNLASTSAGNTFFSTPGCTGVVTSVIIPTSQSSVTYYFADTLVGTPTHTITTATLGTQMQTHTIFAGAPAKLAFTAQPTNRTAGLAISPAIAVQVRDAFDNPVLTATDMVTLTATGPGALAGGGGPLAASGGTATFNAAVINVAGSYTLQATSGVLTPATSASFTITAAAPAKLAFTAQPTNRTAGLAITPAIAVQVRDAFDNLVTTATDMVTLTATGPGALAGGGGPLAASGGTATFNAAVINVAGSYTLQATSGVLTPAASASFTITAAAPAKLAFTVQPTNRAAGLAITPAIAVQVRDAFDNLVTTATDMVTLTATGPGALAGGGGPLAASGGTATFNAAVINVAGTYTLQATSGVLTPATSGSFTIAPAAPAKLAFTAQPTNRTAGLAISPAIAVQVRDAFDNPVLSATDMVTLTATGPGALAGGGGPLAASGGTATFNAAVINVAGTYTLQATSGVLTPATSGSFTIAPAAAAKLAFTVQPTNATAGVAISPAIAVQVRDAFDNPVTTATDMVTLTATGPGALVGGGGPLAASGGTATFNAAVINVAGTYTLQATSGVLTPATSGSFTIAPAAAAKLAFTAQPTNATAGVAISPAIAVQVKDAFDNPVTSATDMVTLTATGPGALAGGGGPLAASGGTATFNAAVINVAGTYTLQATSGVLTPATSGSFTIAHGTASMLAFSTQPSNVVLGATMAQVVVQMRDDYGNLATSASATVGLSLQSNPGGAGLTGGGAVATSGGQATFAGLSLDQIATGYTLRASVSSGPVLTDAISTSFDVTPAPASALLLTGLPASTIAGAPHTVTVEAVDFLGNRVLGYRGTVRFVTDDGTAALPNDFTFTATEQGLATFTNGIAFGSAGTFYVTVYDVADANTKGTVGGIAVSTPIAPLIIEDASLRGVVGVPYRYNALGAVRAGGVAPMTYSKCNGPPELQVDLAGGVAWTPTATGNVSICVQADNANGTDTYSFVVAVSAAPAGPVVAAFTATPNAGPAGTTVAFDGSGSTSDPSTAPLVYQWSYGDGSSPGAGIVSSHRYVMPGGYLGRLVAFDALGVSDDVDHPVLIRNALGQTPPSARILAPTVSGQDSLTVSLSCDCAQGDAAPATYLWDLGNGSTASGPTAQATFGPGRYHVALQVVDANGLTAWDKIEISVSQGARPPPLCRASVDAPAGAAPLTSTFSSYAASSAGAVTTLQWSFDDGDQPTSRTVSKTLPFAGRLGGSLTVTDDVGLTCTDRVELTAIDPSGTPPRIATAALPQATCGVDFQFALNAQGDGPFTWSAPTAPTGLSIDAAGTISWLPLPAQAQQQQQVTLQVSTPVGVDQKTFTVDVACISQIDLGTACGCSASGAGTMAALALLWMIRGRRSRSSRA